MIILKKTNTKKLVLLALLAAIAYLLAALIDIRIIPAAPFLSYEPKDVVITIGGFLLGPVAAFVISLVVALLEMVTVSDTGIIGCLMNLLSTACFACTAAIIYKKKHSVGGAVLGLLVGSAAMVLSMLLWNWLITPLYTGTPREVVVSMLLPVFLPFNALKAGVNSAFILLLYKPLVTALRTTGLLPRQPKSGRSAKWGIYILGVGLLFICVLLVLILQGII